MDRCKVSFGKFVWITLFGSFSLLTSVGDISTDTYVAVRHFMDGHMWWAVFTLLLIILPTFVLNLFSVRWHVLDKTGSRWHWVTHGLLLGVLHRQLEVLLTVWKARSSRDSTDIQRLYKELSNVAVLQLLEAFMESAPQLVLQIYIMKTEESWPTVKCVSAGVSLVFLALAVASYIRNMPHTQPDRILCVQQVWHFIVYISMVSARIAALVLFAVVFHGWVFLFYGVHWLVLTLYSMCYKEDLPPTAFEDFIYNCVLGGIYCFCYFNIWQKQSVQRALLLFGIIGLENLLCLVLFVVFGDYSKSSSVVAISVIAVGTVLGMVSMYLYHRRFHPASHIKLCCRQLQHKMEHGNSSYLLDRNTEQTAAGRSLNTEQAEAGRSLKDFWQTEKNSCSTRQDGTSEKEPIVC